MSLIKWDPFRDIENLRGDVNAILSGWPFKQMYGRDFGQPRVDVYQTEKDVKVTAEIPGLESKNDVEVYVTEDAVQIKGEYKKSTEYNENNVYRNERYFGSFTRVVPLPAEVKPDGATAAYKNGILDITIPKSETGNAKGRRIDIH